MSLHSLLTLLTFLLFIPASSTFAQVAVKEDPREQQKVLEQKALALLDETLAEAGALKLAENRALISASAADLLWSHDEKRARSLFQDALSGLAEIRIKPDRRRGMRGQGEWMKQQLRQQLLHMVARRDPQLALDYLRASRGQSEGEADSPFGEPNMELQLEQSLAARVAARDPKLALQMAEESLAKGISYGLINVITQLQEKDPSLAAKLTGAITDKLRSAGAAANHEALSVVHSLLLIGTQPQASFLISSPTQGTTRKPPQPLDEDTRRDLVRAVAKLALSLPAGSQQLRSVQMMVPLVEKYAPESAPPLRQKFAEFEETLDPRQRGWSEYSALMQNGSAAKMIERAAKAPAGMRTALYQSAAWKLLGEGDANRARQIITEHVRNGEEREQMLEDIDRGLINRAVRTGKPDEARQVIDRIRDKDARAAALAELASGLIAKDDRKSALPLLDEAHRLVKGEAEDDEGVMARLSVARAYALVAPAKSLEILEPLIERANQMLSAAAILDKLGGGPEGLFRQGEVVIASGFGHVGRMLHQFQQPIKAIAKEDFAGAKATADKFGRDELRIMARLLLAQGILAEQQQPEGGNFFEVVGGAGILIGN